MDEELKRVVEAILFAAARKLELEELSKLCRRADADILDILNEWKGQLDVSDSPTMLVQDGSAWKLTVREKYAAVIKKVVTKTELPKSILETLAIVAYKVPVLQSKVVKIRTNKAYDHLNYLENSAFITREKSGRTKLIKLAPKFFEYFDINPSRLKEKFSNVGELERAIEMKEKEIEGIGAQRRKQTEEQLETPQIVISDKFEVVSMVESVEELEETGVEIVEEKLGELPVFDVPKESFKPEEIAEIEAKEAEQHPHKGHHKKHVKKHAHVVHKSKEHVPKEHIVKVHKEKAIEGLTPEQVAESSAKVEAELAGQEKQKDSQDMPEVP